MLTSEFEQELAAAAVVRRAASKPEYMGVIETGRDIYDAWDNLPDDLKDQIKQRARFMFSVRGLMFQRLIATVYALISRQPNLSIPQALLMAGRQLNLRPRQSSPTRPGMSDVQVRQYHRRQQQRGRRPGQNPQMRGRLQRESEAELEAAEWMQGSDPPPSQRLTQPYPYGVPPIPPSERPTRPPSSEGRAVLDDERRRGGFIGGLRGFLTRNLLRRRLRDAEFEDELQQAAEAMASSRRRRRLRGPSLVIGRGANTGRSSVPVVGRPLTLDRSARAGAMLTAPLERALDTYPLLGRHMGDVLIERTGINPNPPLGPGLDATGTTRAGLRVARTMLRPGGTLRILQAPQGQSWDEQQRQIVSMLPPSYTDLHTDHHIENGRDHVLVTATY